MSDIDFNETPIAGSNERKTEVVRVGRRIAETGVVKATSYEERITPDGTLERVTTTEFGVPDCHHVGVEIGGQCLCGLWWCKACSDLLGTCAVCGRLVCPSCGKAKILDKTKKYHRACFWRSVLMKIF
jgi:hypothetical protein